MLKKQVLFCLLLGFCINSIFAQKDTTDYGEKKTFNALEERSKVKYRFIPLPSYDPSIKWGISGIALANYYADKLDTISPPSMSSVLGFATTNGSWGVGLGQTYNFNEDRWRLSAMAAYMSINQNLVLGALGPADAKRTMSIVNIAARRRLVDRLFFGLGYNFRSVDYEGRDMESQDKLDLAGFTNKVGNHGLKYTLAYDTRDNILYTYSGWYLDFSLGQKFDDGSSAGKDNYLEYLFDARYFMPINVNTDHILALNAYARFLGGNPTNENYSFYGRAGSKSQRGYEVGTYVDQNMFSLEAEYRRETPLLKRRLGFVGFAAIGKVYGDYNSFTDAQWLPAVGVGARYRILEYERINFKADVAYGRDGWTIYFGVREAF